MSRHYWPSGYKIPFIPLLWHWQMSSSDSLFPGMWIYRSIHTNKLFHEPVKLFWNPLAIQFLSFLDYDTGKCPVLIDYITEYLREQPREIVMSQRTLLCYILYNCRQAFKSVVSALTYVKLYLPKNTNAKQFPWNLYKCMHLVISVNLIAMSLLWAIQRNRHLRQDTGKSA